MTNPFDDLAKQALEEDARGETTPVPVTHTPEPWKHSGTLIYRLGAEGGTICELSALRKSNMVGHSRLDLNDPDWAEQMANGELIARAPQLYSALRRIKAIIGDRRDLHEVQVLMEIDKAVEGLK